VPSTTFHNFPQRGSSSRWVRIKSSLADVHHQAETQLNLEGCRGGATIQSCPGGGHLDDREDEEHDREQRRGPGEQQQLLAQLGAQLILGGRPDHQNVRGGRGDESGICETKPSPIDRRAKRWSASGTLMPFCRGSASAAGLRSRSAPRTRALRRWGRCSRP
jgi:hypothetical protein